MSIEIHDTGVAAALERAIGHASPFTEGELAGVRALHVRGADTLDELAACTGLERLELIGSDITELGALGALAELRALHVLACPIARLDGLRGLARLEELRVDFAFVEDAAPLFSLPALRRARLLANPWSAESWQRLRAHGLPAPGQTTAGRPIFELGAEREIELEVTRRLHAFGLRLCFGALDGIRTVLVRPGKPRLPEHACDWTVATSDELWIDAKESWTTDRLFALVHEFHTQRGENDDFDFESHREFGDRDDAARWTDGEHDGVRRTFLQQFIARFPGAVFVREDDVFLAMVERRGGVPLPPAYRAARTIVAGAFPERAAELRVRGFAGSSPRETSVSEGAVWYRSRLESYDTDEGPTLRDVARVYPFAFWPVQKRSVLAVSLAAAEPEILEYGEPDLFDALRLGQPAASSLFPVYSSYAELLAHIAAFKLPDGTVIEALADDASGAGAP